MRHTEPEHSRLEQGSAVDERGESHAGHAHEAGLSHPPEHGSMQHGSHAGHQAHDKHAGHDPEAFRRRFWLSLVLTIPVVIFSEMIQDWFNYSLDGIPGHELVSPVLGTFVFVYGGRVFLEGGWHEVQDRQPGMMLLISLAISVAFVASVASTLDLIDLEFWWELSALVTIMLLGHWQEMAAIGRTRGALAALAELIPDEAEVVAGDSVQSVPVAGLKLGDVILVRPGGRVAADGVIVEGQAEFDESMITGESRPVARSTGDHVAGGTVALGSSVRVRVDAVGDETALAGIQRMVEAAQASGSRAQALADRAAAALFYVAVIVGLLTFVVWLGLGDADAAITRTVTVLVIACPHALGLAIPLVIAISTEVAARNGILIKDRLALERMRKVQAVLFDKTGTLTEGKHVVTGTWSADKDDARVLALTAAAEADSEHPLAHAIVAAAREAGSIPQAKNFEALPGRGVRARVGDHLVQVGGPRLLTELGLDAPETSQFEEWRSRGASVLYVVVDKQLAGALALEDRVREASRQAVDDLHHRGVRVAMITGDAKNVADAVAEDIGIDEVFAEVLPETKAEAVIDLQRRGLCVAMVGDGVNDAPALAQADVGIAIGAGTDVAIESADVVLASDDPRGVVSIIELSHASYRKMVQNLAWATGYNLFAIPLAAGVLAFADVTVGPAVGAVLMSLSTVIVALNAQLLRRVDLGRIEGERP
jgi:Cu2+-exporting ATPase